MGRGMSLSDQRAIKITELNEQLDEAREIIDKFVWPPDRDKRSQELFLIKAARFSGCTVPTFKNEGNSDDKSEKTQES